MTFLGQLFQMIACEEDSIYVIQQRFYEMFPGEFHEHSIWRKDASMVRYHKHFKKFFFFFIHKIDLIFSVEYIRTTFSSQNINGKWY